MCALPGAQGREVKGVGGSVWDTEEVITWMIRSRSPLWLCLTKRRNKSLSGGPRLQLCPSNSWSIAGWEPYHCPRLNPTAGAA